MYISLPVSSLFPKPRVCAVSAAHKHMEARTIAKRNDAALLNRNIRNFIPKNPSAKQSH